MGIVYAISNDKNDKKYFGILSKNGKQAKELLNHRMTLLNYKDTNSGQLKNITNKAIRKEIMDYDGNINWKYDIIEENIPNESLNSRKLSWIRQFNTNDPRFGYNIRLSTYQRMIGDSKEYDCQISHDAMMDNQKTINIDSHGSINFNGSFEGLLKYINTLKEIINDKKINIDIKWN